jgi:hypothetical protein
MASDDLFGGLVASRVAARRGAARRRLRARAAHARAAAPRLRAEQEDPFAPCHVMFCVVFTNRWVSFLIFIGVAIIIQIFTGEDVAAHCSHSEILPIAARVTWLLYASFWQGSVDDSWNTIYCYIYNTWMCIEVYLAFMNTCRRPYGWHNAIVKRTRAGTLCLWDSTRFKRPTFAPLAAPVSAPRRPSPSPAAIAGGHRRRPSPAVSRRCAPTHVRRSPPSRRAGPARGTADTRVTATAAAAWVSRSRGRAPIWARSCRRPTRSWATREPRWRAAGARGNRRSPG